jgi:hypothetical protein
MQTPTAFTILFHGNCIDGWFSAYIAHEALSQSGTVQLFPISPQQSNHWPSIQKMAGTHILLVDVSVEKQHRDAWEQGGALSVDCFDHHHTSMEHWPADGKQINVEHCAAILTFQHFCPGRPIPDWLHMVDRIDRWDNPTEEDRCMREIFNQIAHKPVEQQNCTEALANTRLLMQHLDDPAMIRMYLEQGKVILTNKDNQLFAILSKLGRIYCVNEEMCTAWQLPATWLHANVFIVDNTEMVIDSTEAAHITFMHHPHVNIFVNYRKKSFLKKEKGNVVQKTAYVYSARSRAFNLTEGTFLKGHPTSAGASLTVGEVPCFPFLCTF